MKHWIVGLSLVLAFFFVAPIPVAHAWSWSSFFGKSSQGRGNHGKSMQSRGNHGKSMHSKRWKYGKARKDHRSSVPELDPGAAGSAIVLLLGGVAYVLSRRREEENVA